MRQVRSKALTKRKGSGRKGRWHLCCRCRHSDRLVSRSRWLHWRPQSLLRKQSSSNSKLLNCSSLMIKFGGFWSTLSTRP